MSDLPIDLPPIDLERPDGEDSAGPRPPDVWSDGTPMTKAEQAASKVGDDGDG